MTLPVSESGDVLTAGADTTRDPDLPQTQSLPTTASPQRFNHHEMILPKIARSDILDGVTTSYQFPKVRPGVGGVTRDLSQRMFGANGLLPDEFASHLSVLTTFGPGSAALYV